jgi:hypothetical protein
MPLAYLHFTARWLPGKQLCLKMCYLRDAVWLCDSSSGFCREFGVCIRTWF